MTTVRVSGAVSGSVTNGALLWNGADWVNTLIAAANIASGSALALTGTGSPQGSVTASPGAFYLNVSGGAGSTLWVKETGTNTNTGWVAK